MALIRKITICWNSTDVKKHFDVAINYSIKEKQFTITLPDELKHIFVTLSEAEQNDLKLTVRKEANYYGDKLAADYLVVADTERLCETRAIDIFKLLNEKQVIRREVIVIDFNEQDNHFYKSQYNEHTPRVGMSLGLLYCTETKAGVNGQPQYTIKSISKLPFEPYAEQVTYSHKQISKDNPVVDDTPENRLFLENTYNLLSKLIDNMKTHFGSTEATQQLIASNQKLLS